MALRAWWAAAVVLAVAVGAVPESAFASDDREARLAFEEGRVAFERARYEEALTAFRRSYELSGRGQLLYNIGLAADRLRRDEEALDAFERYLIEVDDPPRGTEVRQRIRAIRNAMVSRDADEAASENVEESGIKHVKRSKKRAIVGPVILGAVGLTGMSLLAVGLAKKGKCVSSDATGACTERNKLNKGAAAAYGAVGGSALLGAALWFSLSGKEDNTMVGVGVGTLEVRGKF